MTTRRPIRTLMLTALALLIAAAAPAETVLLVGNSQFAWNDLPGDLTALAAAGGHVLLVGTSTMGGSSIGYHTQYQPTLDAIASQHWDHVFVQESTVIPVIPYWAEHSFFPMAARMDSIITAAGSEMTLFMHWPYPEPEGPYCIEGHCSRTFTGPLDMHADMSPPYWQLADELGVDLVPAGDVWARTLEQYPLMPLWDTDLIHPSNHGTYFAACILYAYIFGESPEGLEYYGSVPDASAQAYQRNAWPLPLPEVACAVSPIDLDFGTVALGAHRDRGFTIRNTGTLTFEGAVAADCDAFEITVGAGAYSLAPGDTHRVTVRFEPFDVPLASCTITTGLPDCASVTCTGRGLGTEPPPPAGHLSLLSSYPNPARGGARVAFELSGDLYVSIEIFDAAGRRVRELARGSMMPPGPHLFLWDGCDADGNTLPAGVYVVRVAGGGTSLTNRVTLLR